MLAIERPQFLTDGNLKMNINFAKSHPYFSLGVIKDALKFGILKFVENAMQTILLKTLLFLKKLIL